MIGAGLLFLCLLFGLRLTWKLLRHRGLTLFVGLIGLVAIESYARAGNAATRQSAPSAADPNILACQQIDTAIQACGALIDANPTESEALAWAYNNRGIAAAAKGDLLNAIADYSKAIELAPNDAPAWANRGSAHAALGDLLPALADHQKALELAPGNASSWHNRGVDFEELGQHRKALADYAKAITLDPRHVGSHVGLATANCKLGRIKASAQARLALVEKGLIPALAMQQILKDDGFYAGPLDGLFGKGSRAALRAWTRKGCLSHA
jgi:tetratricopeptide (TPR) repeat protein